MSNDLHENGFKHRGCHGIRLKGSCLTLRTGKCNPFNGLQGSFHAFYVPHRNSYLPLSVTKSDALRIHKAQADYIHSVVSGKGSDLIGDDLLIFPPDAALDYRLHDMKEKPIEGITKGKLVSADFISVQAPQMYSASTSLKYEIAGTIFDGNVLNARNGTLFRMTGKRRMSRDFGSETQSASFMIKVRSGASYKRVAMDLPEFEGRSFSDMYVEGRFDIVPLSVAYKMGIAPLGNPTFEAMHDPIFFDEVFTVTEVHPEIEALPVVREVGAVNNKGEKVFIRKSKPRRMLGG